MKGLFKDYEHLVRVVLLLVGGVVVFFGIATLMIPKGFGAYGHFRAGALDDIGARPLAYAGHAACEECHGDVAAKRKGSRHAQIACESCHGPLAAHAGDPTTGKPARPTKRALCLECHAASAARPAKFPQFDKADMQHADIGNADCTDCHEHHHPDAGGSK